MTDLLETTEDGIAWLTLDRPDRLNAFSPAMLLGLGEALPRLGSDADVGAIIITGAGRGFCVAASGPLGPAPARPDHHPRRGRGEPGMVRVLSGSQQPGDAD